MKVVNQYATSTFPITHLICPQNFAKALFSISLRTAVVPMGNEKQRLCKILWGKQGSLWKMWKWRINRFSLKKRSILLLLILNDVLLFYVCWSVNLNNFPLAVQSMYKCRFSVRFSCNHPTGSGHRQLFCCSSYQKAILANIYHWWSAAPHLQHRGSCGLHVRLQGSIDACIS